MTGRDGAARVREVRRRLNRDGPAWTRGPELDFATVTLPERDCDQLRDLLIAERAGTVVEVGLAYGSSALAIGEALLAVGAERPRHVIIDPFQREAYHDVGWNVLAEAGLTGANPAEMGSAGPGSTEMGPAEPGPGEAGPGEADLTRAGRDAVAELIVEPSSLALPRLLSGGLVADVAFVDGSHRFHEVFVDFYFLRKIVKPGGLIVLDDDWAPSVRTALHYFERNLGWTVLHDALPADARIRAVRLPAADLTEPPFEAFRSFGEPTDEQADASR